MGKIIKLKNKKTGEHVYPVSVTKAIADPDSGERLNDILLNKVEEAPMDGNQYVRSSGTWKVAELATAGVERCNISLVSNQGEGDASSLYGATITITNIDSGEIYKSEEWEGNEIQFEIEPGINYKVSASSVQKYATPEEKVFTSLEQNVRNIILTYNTEIVSVTLSADSGDSVNGQIVSINGTQQAWNGIAITQKVAYGTTYNVSVNALDGYKSPESKSFTAGQQTRNVEFVYEMIKDGVYIQATDGSLIRANKWDGTKTANGIAVFSGENFVLSLHDAKSECEWGKEGVLVNGIFTTEDSEEFTYAYDGIGETDKIVEQLLGATDVIPAAYYCKNFTFPNGKKGYLPSAGEWWEVRRNMNAIEEALNACGGTPLLHAPYTYWVTTQATADKAWNWYIDFPDAFVMGSKSKKYIARALTTI